MILHYYFILEYYQYARHYTYKLIKSKTKNEGNKIPMDLKICTFSPSAQRSAIFIASNAGFAFFLRICVKIGKTLGNQLKSGGKVK